MFPLNLAYMGIEPPEPSPDPFEHRPLDLNKTQIRLFRSVPGASLGGEITTHDFEHCPPYKAVSYTWGRPDRTRKIYLNDQTFTVRKNLWNFLDAVRHRDEGWLWIDQICINQAVVDERNHQVGLMARIYAEAGEVLIWLGAEAEGSNEAMLAIDYGYNAVRKHAAEVQALFRRPYWRRLWILQEVLMSRSATVICGNRRFPWERMEKLFTPKLRGIEGKWKYPANVDSFALSLIKEKAAWTGADQRLSYILDTFSGLQCQDVRDKIYGLLSLVRVSEAIVVDYSKSSAEVFFDAIRMVVQDEPFMDLESHMEVALRLRLRMKLEHISDEEILLHMEKELRTAREELTKEEHRRSFLLASREGAESTVKRLLQTDVNVEWKDRLGRTPLWLTAENGHEAVVKLLLAAEANLEAKDNRGWTPLFAAIGSGQGGVVRLLLQEGASIDARDEYGLTPLLIAARGGDQLVVKLLLEKGVDLEARNDDGQTPLWIAAGSGRKSVVELLLENGANMETKDVNDQTPLSTAAECNHDAVVELLLEKGANLECEDSEGRTPLLKAASSGHDAVVQLLLGNGANIEAKDVDGLTSLPIAARFGHMAVVKQLLLKGANPKSKDRFTWTPSQWARYSGHKEIAELLDSTVEK